MDCIRYHKVMEALLLKYDIVMQNGKRNAPWAPASPRWTRISPRNRPIPPFTRIHRKRHPKRIIRTYVAVRHTQYGTLNHNLPSYARRRAVWLVHPTVLSSATRIRSSASSECRRAARSPPARPFSRENAESEAARSVLTDGGERRDGRELGDWAHGWCGGRDVTKDAPSLPHLSESPRELPLGCALYPPDDQYLYVHMGLWNPWLKNNKLFKYKSSLSI